VRFFPPRKTEKSAALHAIPPNSPPPPRYILLNNPDVLSLWSSFPLQNGKGSHQIPSKKSCVVLRVEFWKIYGVYPEDVGITIHSFRLRCGYVFRNFCILYFVIACSYTRNMPSCGSV